MHIPDGIPILSRGTHTHPLAGACFMEYTSLLAGEMFSDNPRCTDPGLSRCMQIFNDRTADADRHRLVPLLGRCIGLVYQEDGDRLRYAARRIFQKKISTAFAVMNDINPLEPSEYSGIVLTWKRLLTQLAPFGIEVKVPEDVMDRRVKAAELLHESYEEVMAQLGIEKKYTAKTLLPEVQKLVRV